MTGGRGPFVLWGDGPVEDDPFASPPGSATVDLHGHTVGAGQTFSVTVVSAPLTLGPGAPPSSTPRSTSFDDRNTYLRRAWWYSWFPVTTCLSVKYW